MSPRLLRLRPLGPAAVLAALLMGGLLVVAPAHGGGAKAAATIGAAVRNVQVTVQGSPSRPSTGSATPQRQ